MEWGLGEKEGKLGVLGGERRDIGGVEGALEWDLGEREGKLGVLGGFGMGSWGEEREIGGAGGLERVLGGQKVVLRGRNGCWGVSAGPPRASIVHCGRAVPKACGSPAPLHADPIGAPRTWRGC